MRTRKKIRLAGYDYSQDGVYFVTICSRERENIFARVGAALVPARRVGAPLVYALRVSAPVHTTINNPQNVYKQNK